MERQNIPLASLYLEKDTLKWYQLLEKSEEPLE